jgi:hypothetical protein
MSDSISFEDRSSARPIQRIPSRAAPRASAVCSGAMRSLIWPLGSVRTNAPIVRRGGVGRLHAPPKQARQPVSLLQLVTRGDPPRGNDVRAVSAVAAQRRRSAVRARYRHLPRDGADAVEQVRPDDRRRHTPAAGTVRPNAPGENGGVANGTFKPASYSELAVSAADSFGLFPDVRTIACRRASNRGLNSPTFRLCGCSDNTTSTHRAR